MYIPELGITGIVKSAVTMNWRASEHKNYLKKYSNETYDSLSPITWLLNLFAISSNVIKDAACTKNACYFIKTFITFATLGSLSIYSLLYKNLYFYKHTSIAPSIKLTDTAQIVYDLIQYFIDLWFVYQCGRNISLEYFKQYEQIDTILGMTYFYKIKRELIRLLSIFTLIWLLTSACDFAAWYLSFGWGPPTAYSVAYIFLYIKILTTIDMSSHVMQIRIRLMIIGNIVLNYFSVAESLPGFSSRWLSNRERIYGKLSGSPRSTKIKCENTTRARATEDYKEVNLLSRCYLQLTEQVAFINNMFGFRILLNSLSLLIDIIRFTNIAIRVALGTQLMPNDSKYFPAISSVMRQITCVLVLISLVNQCEKAYRQREAITMTIDHLLINKNPSEKLRTSMRELRGLLQARPIAFSLANFFELNNSLLVSIASIVVTYTIILLQSMN